MEIYYEDKHMVICQKPTGVLSQSDGTVESVETLLTTQLGTRVSAVHRLDAPVGGCMALAKSKKSAAALGRAVANHQLKKEYLAVVKGPMDGSTGTLQDLLYHDARANKTFVVKTKRKGVKEAILHYSVLKTAEYAGETWSLLSIVLETGRTHQIRIQFGSRQHPLWGDKRYGGTGESFGLWAHHLELPHPIQKKTVEATSEPPAEKAPWSFF
ncbi:MAG: RluA family pseudouridine synthase [Eubacteriales bacterium]